MSRASGAAGAARVIGRRLRILRGGGVFGCRLAANQELGRRALPAKHLFGRCQTRLPRSLRPRRRGRSRLLQGATGARIRTEGDRAAHSRVCLRRTCRPRGSPRGYRELLGAQAGEALSALIGARRPARKASQRRNGRTGLRLPENKGNGGLMERESRCLRARGLSRSVYDNTEDSSFSCSASI